MYDPTTMDGRPQPFSIKQKMYEERLSYAIHCGRLSTEWIMCVRVKMINFSFAILTRLLTLIYVLTKKA